MPTEQQGEAKAPWIERLAADFAECICRRPVLVLCFALTLAGLSMLVAGLSLEFHTQRNDLINPNKDYLKRWQQYITEFGDDEDIVVVVQGKSEPRMIEALERIGAGLQQHPDVFDRLFYSCDLRSLRNRALLFLPSGQIADIQNHLQSMKLLLDPPLVGGYEGWRVLTLGKMLDEACTRAGDRAQSDALEPGDRIFYTQLQSIAATASRVLDDPAAYANPWQSILPAGQGERDQLAEPQYFFSGDRSLAFLLVRPVKEAGSFTAVKTGVDKVREIIAAAEPDFADLKLGCTGLPVLETDEMVASQNDTNTASWLALAGVWGLYLVVFRGIRYPLMTVGALLVGTAWAMGLLTISIGHLNILSATFAVMLIGMGDYGVLWVTRYHQEKAAGLDVVAAMRNTAAGVGPGIMTAAATTALAFYAAMLADFQAVAELGWIAGSGVILCALSCFVIMPAALRLFDRRKTVAKPVDPKAAALAWLPALAARPRTVVGVSLAVTLVLGVCAFQIHYDHNLLHLQADDLDSVRWEQTLIQHTAGASWHTLSYTDTAEEALALKAKYEKLPDVSRVVEVASLVPPGQKAKIEQLRDIQKRLQNLPPRGEPLPHARPDVAALRSRIRDTLASLEPAAARTAAPLLSQLLKSLRSLQAALARTEDDVAAARLQAFDNHLARDLADDLHKLRDVSTPAPIGLTDLPPRLRERFVGNTGKWLLQVFAKESLWEYAALKHFVDQIRRVDPEATGKPFSTLEGLRSMKHGFEWAAVYALLAIVAVFYLDFRSVWHTLLALAPLAMGMIVSLGVMSLIGMPLNPANMIAFPLILGVGADNGVHVLHDFLHHRGEGQYTLGRTTGQGIMVAALTTILGFGTLMISQHRGLASLGFILTLGVSCCMVTALVFLPAALRLLSLRSMPVVATLRIYAPQEQAAEEQAAEQPLAA
jgi:uncharacterized protein